MVRTYTAVIQYDAESKAYVGFVPALPGTHSCGDTLEELRSNLKEAMELMLEELQAEGEHEIEDTSIILEPIEIAV